MNYHFPILFFLLLGFSVQAQEPYDPALKGVKFLESIQRDDGAIADTSNSLFEIWETIEATHALVDYYGDTNRLSIQSGLHYLRQWINADGLICHNSTCSKGYCIETSAAYFLLLKKIGLEKKCKKGIAKIIELQLVQGYWEIGNPDVREATNFPSVTAFALSVLQFQDSLKARLNKGFRFLELTQSRSGHWSNSWEYYGCNAYAIWATSLAYQSHPKIFPSAVKKKTLRYIKQTQSPGHLWEFDSAGKEGHPISAELQTGLIALALINYGESSTSKYITAWKDELVKRQISNGAWSGGYFPIPKVSYRKAEYVFATSKVIQVFVRTKKKK